MNDESRALINYRLQQAEDSIEEAKILLQAEMSPRSVMNRLYYAMFYVVLALLQAKQMGTSKHIGAISFFDREFVKTGIFSKELSKILHQAFELRQKGDYMEQADVKKEDLEEIFPKVIDFVEQIKSYLLRS